MADHNYRELTCPRCDNRVSSVLADGEAKDATCIWCGAWLRTHWNTTNDDSRAVEWRQVDRD